jgi:hypothetical protein
MAKVVITKLTAEGEQLSLEVANVPKEIEHAFAKDRHALHTWMSPYFQLVDDRLREMNVRVAAQNVMLRKLGPEVQLVVRQLHDILYGQIPAADLEVMIAQDNAKRAAEMQKPEVREAVEGVIERLVDSEDGDPTYDGMKSLAESLDIKPLGDK